MATVFLQLVSELRPHFLRSRLNTGPALFLSFNHVLKRKRSKPSSNSPKGALLLLLLFLIFIFPLAWTFGIILVPGVRPAVTHLHTLVKPGLAAELPGQRRAGAGEGGQSTVTACQAPAPPRAFTCLLPPTRARGDEG